MAQDKQQEILQVTQEMIRRGGYNGFSFRNIATAVGVKSSSVHYHYATKEDLGVAAAKDYTDQFIAQLGEPTDILSSGGNPIHQYVAAFRSAKSENKGMCLCGVLAAEADNLPDRIVAELHVFFERNIQWLTQAYTALGMDENADQRATQTLSGLQGAMVIANATGNIDQFDVAVAHILENADV